MASPERGPGSPAYRQPNRRGLRSARRAARAPARSARQQEGETARRAARRSRCRRRRAGAATRPRRAGTAEAPRGDRPARGGREGTGGRSARASRRAEEGPAGHVAAGVGIVGYSGLRLRAETGSKAWVIVPTMTATAVATYRQTDIGRPSARSVQPGGGWAV